MTDSFPADIYYGSVLATAAILIIPCAVVVVWEAVQRARIQREMRFYEHRYWDLVERLRDYQERDL